jgi:hypothetical protein
MPRSAIGGLCGVDYMFSVARNCQTKWLYYFAFPPAESESSCCSIFSPEFPVVSVFDFGHSDRYDVVSHCFNL